MSQRTIKLEKHFFKAMTESEGIGIIIFSIPYLTLSIYNSIKKTGEEDVPR